MVGLAGLKPVSIPLLVRVGAARSDVQRRAGLGTRVRSPAPSLAELCGRTPNRTGLSCRREHCCEAEPGDLTRAFLHPAGHAPCAGFGQWQRQCCQSP